MTLTGMRHHRRSTVCRGAIIIAPLFALVTTLTPGFAQAQSVPTVPSQNTESPNLSMVLITNDRYPGTGVSAVRAQGIKAFTLNLDVPARIHRRLDANLPANETLATELIKERINAITPEEMMSFYRPLALIIKWELTRIPAMVFGDGQYVVYGVTDYESALSIYQDAQP